MSDVYDDDYERDGPTQPLPDFESPTVHVNPQRVGLDLQEWYDRWSVRFSMWIGKNNLDPDYEHILQTIPDFVEMVIACLQDSRLPMVVRAELASAREYLLNPGYLLPEDRHGIEGLLDDALILLKPLQRIAQAMPALIEDSWTGSDDPLEMLDFIDSHQGDILAYIARRRGNAD